MRKNYIQLNLLIAICCSLLIASCTNNTTEKTILKLTTIDDNRYLEIGELYKANLLIAKNGNPIDATKITKILVDGKEIPVIDGIGIIEIKPTLDKDFAENENYIKKSFQAFVEILDSTGEKESHTKQFEYFVKRPNLQYNTSFSSILYLNCENPVLVNGFNLQEEEKLHYEIEGGEIRTSDEPNKVIVLPRKEQVEMKIYQGNVLLAQKSFTAVNFPKPELKVLSKGKALELKKGIPVNKLGRIELKLIVDKHFKEHFPEDSKFEIKSCSIYIIRDGKLLNITSSTSSEINLTRIRNIASSGDLLLIEINKVIRYNSDNKSEEMDYNYLPVTLSII